MSTRYELMSDLIRTNSHSKYYRYNNNYVQCQINSKVREVVKKNNGLFTVRLTVRVDPPLPPPYGQGFVIFSK